MIYMRAICKAVLGFFPSRMTFGMYQTKLSLAPGRNKYLPILAHRDKSSVDDGGESSQTAKRPDHSSTRTSVC